jgi:hypothetical protein
LFGSTVPTAHTVAAMFLEGLEYETKKSDKN